MTYATVFSGVEGSGRGLEAAGLKRLWACERDKFAASVIRYRYPGLTIFDDVRTLPSDDALAPDVLWGSPPCQDLSIAGKRKGLEGSRSGLFYDFIHIARNLIRRGTRFLLMEQVPGLLSSHGGEDFRSVLNEFLELGAVDLAWRLLDSQYFGVAQRRRRLFFAVDFGGECAGEILALSEGMCGHPAPIREAGQIAPTLFASGAGTSRTASCGTESEFLIPEVAGTLGHQKGGWATSLDTSVAFIPKPVMVRWASEGGETIQPIADTLRSEAEHSYQFVYEAGPVAFNGATSALQTMRIDAETTDPTRSANTQQPYVLENMRVRRLTPRECERLQGFPDDWTRWGVNEYGQTVEISDAQRYKMCGNAVTATVAKWLSQNLMEAVL